MVSGERYVTKLQEELGKRAPMFVDDANFIRCPAPPLPRPPWQPPAATLPPNFRRYQEQRPSELLLLPLRSIH